jgi:hypothetical protein
MEKLTEVANSLLAQIAEKAKEQQQFYHGATEGIKLLYQELTKPEQTNDDTEPKAEDSQSSGQAQKE